MGSLSLAILGLVIAIAFLVIDPKIRIGGGVGVIILGVLGSVLGGFVSSLVLTTVGLSGLNLSTLVIAVSGSLLLLLISRMLKTGV